MTKPKSIFDFTSADGTFRVADPNQSSYLYFPLVNEAGLLSAIGPALQGDIKLDQHSFLTQPTVTEDLQESRSARNFWLSFSAGKNRAPICWSINGRSAAQRAKKSGSDTTMLEAGLLWHQLTRTNKELGIEARVLNFVPPLSETIELMVIEIKNISRRPIEFTATSAIPLYGRSADNLRDHRHVTSLLNRVSKEKFGLRLCPTMSFNERGHLVNHTSYFVCGTDHAGQPPVGLFPTMASFVGEGGDLEQPRALLEGTPPKKNIDLSDQGKEVIGALRFKTTRLKSGESVRFSLLLGIDRNPGDHDALVKKLLSRSAIDSLLAKTKDHWLRTTSQIVFETGDSYFNQWTRWITAQPVFRKIFGCSFLPDFDYGRGGRGWRDLWQDCLALLLADPSSVRDDIVRNYGGVRIDGSNATIIARRRVETKGDAIKWEPEFVADRNNITRTWMDHGLWPFLTTRLYLHQTGDWNVLLEPVSYFRDPLTHRGRRVDGTWADSEKKYAGDVNAICKLRTGDKKIYRGSLIEHVLVQTLVPFFNVGEHNIIRLEDADWNDGMDMAHEKGESVAFTHLYAGNLESLADILEDAHKNKGWNEIPVAEELLMLFDRIDKKINYELVKEKTQRLQQYFDTTARGVSGKQVPVGLMRVVADLREKADWIKRHLNRQEWIELPNEKLGWYNGYYDNNGARVEGRQANGQVRMTLTGQVFAVMAGVADSHRIGEIIKAVNRFLFDKSLGGIRLNTNFGGMQPALGRAFSFSFGEKENGAIFSHMVVMYANALYQRGASAEGYRVLSSLYHLATHERGRIYPGLPEYFNNDGRGRYSYLTGSASWYVLTLLTQVFGIRGEFGDLLIAPKLVPEQFNKDGEARVKLTFAGTRLSVFYKNSDLVPPDRIRIESIQKDGVPISFSRRDDGEALIARGKIAGQKSIELTVILGARSAR